MVRELNKLTGKSATQLRAEFLKDEEKDFVAKQIPNNPDKGKQTREGYLVRRCFWRGLAKVFSLKNKYELMDELERFSEKWEEVVSLPWAGAAEYSAVQYAGCSMHEGYVH